MRLNRHARDEAGAGGTAPAEDGLAGADLAGRDLSDRDLSGENLAGADLTGANLSGANLSGANLRDAILVDAQAAGAIFAGADLRTADLGAAYLVGADFTDANLRWVGLELADLTDANLTNADLRSAVLSDRHMFAVLNGAILNGARFNGAILPDDQRDWLLRSGAVRPRQLSAFDSSDGELAAGVPGVTLSLLIVALRVGARYLRYRRAYRSGARQRRGGLESGDQHHTSTTEIEVSDETE